MQMIGMKTIFNVKDSGEYSVEFGVKYEDGKEYAMVAYSPKNKKPTLFVDMEGKINIRDDADAIEIVKLLYSALRCQERPSLFDHMSQKMPKIENLVAKSFHDKNEFCTGDEN